jgi:CheY-like chemotaxis protein
MAQDAAGFGGVGRRRAIGPQRETASWKRRRAVEKSYRSMRTGKDREGTGDSDEPSGQCRSPSSSVPEASLHNPSTAYIVSESPNGEPWAARALGPVSGRAPAVRLDRGASRGDPKHGRLGTESTFVASPAGTAPAVASPHRVGRGAGTPVRSRFAGAMAKTAVVGGSREVRLLIKGLLRLHRHVVVAEGPSFDVLDGLPPDAQPEVVVVDFDLAEPGRIEAIKVARKARPKVRFVLLTPGGGTPMREAGRAVGADAVIGRPFAVRDLVEAVAPGESSSTRPP